MSAPQEQGYRLGYEFMLPMQHGGTRRDPPLPTQQEHPTRKRAA